MSVWCLYGVSAVFSRTFFEAMHLNEKKYFIHAISCELKTVRLGKILSEI